MNKKFFAALASATMAFTASGSIAVFADDFVEENTPSIDAGDLNPLPEKVKWNEENFGDLVKANDSTWNGTKPEVTDGYVDTKNLKAVTTITLQSDFKGEIKGLEYFTGLTTFTSQQGTVTNKTLDFSANTALTALTVTNAKDLKDLTLPKADEDEVYHSGTLTVANAELPSLDLSKQEALTKLSLTNTQTTSLTFAESEELTSVTLINTKLTSLDLSKQEGLTTVTVTGNYNLKDVDLKNGKKGSYKKLPTLNLSNNALETVNLDYMEITTLNLGGNHIGALDLSKTKATNVSLGNGTNIPAQTFYVSEDAANVKLTEAFPELKVWNVDNVQNGKFDKDKGVLTLKEDQTDVTYDYKVAVGETPQTMTVKITKANPMNRLYNPNSGEHFYTADIKEKEALVALGWNDEGTGWVAPRDNASNVDKVYRLYNPNAGDHHYTMDENQCH